MAVEIHPIRLRGNWDLGYALDQHVISSIPLGEDPFGHQQFDNTRSEIGELMYQFKYQHHHEYIDDIVSSIMTLLDEHPEMRNVQSIIPVPPTMSRDYQPTIELGKALGKQLNIYCCPNVLEKQSGIVAKELTAEDKHKLHGSIIKRGMAKYRHNVLLLDDIFQSGTTLSQCVDALREDPNVNQIFVITITKTKNSSR